MERAVEGVQDEPEDLQSDDAEQGLVTRLAQDDRALGSNKRDAKGGRPRGALMHDLDGLKPIEYFSKKKFEEIKARNQPHEP